MPLQVVEDAYGLLATAAAGVRLCFKGMTQRGVLCRSPENAMMVSVEVDAGYAGGFSLRHTRQSLLDGRRNAAGSATDSALQLRHLFFDACVAVQAFQDFNINAIGNPGAYCATFKTLLANLHFNPGSVVI